MKKALIGIAGILILAIVVVLFINAREGVKVSKKAGTEMKSDCGNPMATPCEQKTVKTAGTEAEKTETKACCPAKAVTEVKDCDPASCPEHSAAAMETAKPCCAEAPKTGTATK